MQEFWCLYASEMPYKEREKILFPSLSNADSPMHVMQTAMCLDDFDEEIRSLESGEPVRLDGPFGGLPANGRSAVEIAKETRLEAMEELGTWLKGCILNKNAAALRSLANSLHIEYPWEEQANKNKEPQLKPRLLYSFCELLQKNRAIPTRVELEDAAGIIRQVESGKASSKNVASALKSLGLDVLPK